MGCYSPVEAVLVDVPVVRAVRQGVAGVGEGDPVIEQPERPLDAMRTVYEMMRS